MTAVVAGDVTVGAMTSRAMIDRTLGRSGLTIERARSKLSGWHFAKETLDPTTLAVLGVAEALLGELDRLSGGYTRVLLDDDDAAAVAALTARLHHGPPTTIADRLPDGTEPSPGRQSAWHACVHVLVPNVDADGRPVHDPAAADRYLTRTLTPVLLDWAYRNGTVTDDGDDRTAASPVELDVCEPYVTGTFLDTDS